MEHLNTDITPLEPSDFEHLTREEKFQALLTAIFTWSGSVAPDLFPELKSNDYEARNEAAAHVSAIIGLILNAAVPMLWPKGISQMAPLGDSARVEQAGFRILQSTLYHRASIHIEHSRNNGHEQN